MRRREFIILLGGATAWPLAARAQQGRLPVVGVLRSNPKDTKVFAEPFRRYMKAIGWEEGRNIRFLFVWTEGRSERAPALAGELIAQNVDLIITFGDPCGEPAIWSRNSVGVRNSTSTSLAELSSACEHR